MPLTHQFIYAPNSSTGKPLDGVVVRMFTNPGNVLAPTYADRALTPKTVLVTGAASEPGPGQVDFYIEQGNYDIEFNYGGDNVERITDFPMTGDASNTFTLASQAEAEAGVENTKVLTSLRTKQAIDAQAVTKTAAAASSGASLVGFLQSGAGAVTRTAQAKMREIVSVDDFGAVGDGVADDTAAIQAAIDAVKVAGGIVYFPTGTYKISDHLVVDTGVYATGIILAGQGRNSIISQVTTSKDAIRFSTTQILQNSGIRDLKIVCDADAGHCINILYGCTTCFVSNVDMEQNNPAKSLVYGDYTSFGGGVYDTKFSGGSWYCAATSTVPGVDFIANGTIFNENIFENLRCYNANTVQFVRIRTVTAANIWLINNVFRNINFEICKGGGIYCDSFKNGTFQNLSFWDTGAAYTNNLIEMAAGAGFEAASNTFINIGRNGDTLAVGVNDIKIVSGQDTVMINVYTQSADAPVYDLGSKRVVVIGKLFGTVNNAGALTFLNSIDGLRFPGTVNGAPLNYYDEGTFTPTFTNLTIGNGTLFGEYVRVGKQVTATFGFILGSTSAVTGTLSGISGMPFATATLGPSRFFIVNGVMFESGVGSYGAYSYLFSASTTGSGIQNATNNANVNATSPFTWGTDDSLSLTVIYIMD